MTVNTFTYVFGFIQVGLVGAVWEGNLKFLDFNLSSSAQVIAVLYAVSIDSFNSLKLINKLLGLNFVHRQVALCMFSETREIKRFFGVCYKIMKYYKNLLKIENTLNMSYN